jgi:hypothetical protein
VAVPIVALAVVANAAAARRQLDPLDRSTLALGDDPVVSAARSLTGTLVSNAPGALWLHGGLDAGWVPKDTDPYTARARPEVVAELAAMRASLRTGDHLVWLRFYDYRSYLPTEAEVVAALGLVLELERPDGAIYGVP